MNGISCFVLAGSLLAAISAHAQDEVFTPEDIKAKLVGKKLFTRGSNGILADYVMFPDGTSSLSASTNFSDTGTWRLDDKGYCAKWKKIRNGAEACFTIVRRGPTVYVLNADGSVSGEILRMLD